MIRAIQRIPKSYWPKEEAAHWQTVEWLMWQMGGIGPMIGQVHHFLRNAKGKAPYAEERYIKEAHRLYGVLDRRLAQVEYMAGSYSIADMATWPWISRFEWHTVDLNGIPGRDSKTNHKNSHDQRAGPSQPQGCNTAS